MRVLFHHFSGVVRLGLRDLLKLLVVDVGGSHKGELRGQASEGGQEVVGVPRVALIANAVLAWNRVLVSVP